MNRVDDIGAAERISNQVPISSGEQLLRMRDVTMKVGLGKSKVYAMIGEGQFPRPVIAGGAAVRWRSSDIEAWIAALPLA